MSYKNRILQLIKEDEDTLNFSTTTDDLDATVDAVQKSTDSGDETNISVSDSDVMEGEEDVVEGLADNQGSGNMMRDDIMDEGSDDLKVPDDAEAHEEEYLEKEKLKKQLKKPVADETINEGKWTNIMRGVRKSPQPPFTIVAIQNGKVVDQSTGITIADAIPAHYEAMKKKFPSANISIENGEGLSVFNEGTITNEVVGRMSKQKLEKLVEQNKNIGNAYTKIVEQNKKKIIKVSEIRSKNG